MKKAQLFAQPLFYIFVLIIASLFLIFGIRAIFNLKEKADLIELATSINDLEKTVDAYYTFEQGSSKEINIKLPSQIEYICFTNNNPQQIPEELRKYGDLKKLFTLAKDNTFILPITSFKQNAFTIEHLTVSQDPLCIQTANSLKAVITNVGTSVEISPQ